jgi:predicted O-methyltransferase YrrM
MAPFIRLLQDKHVSKSCQGYQSGKTGRFTDFSFAFCLFTFAFLLTLPVGTHLFKTLSYAFKLLCCIGEIAKISIASTGESKRSYPMSEDPQTILNRMITDRQTFNREGTALQVTGTISLPEAQYIQELIIRNEFSTCLETGVAYGASTVAICSALASLEAQGKSVKHYGIDPCQIEIYKGAAISALKECGLGHIFELCAGPSHLMLPKLIERNVIVDFVFIDGMHTFDYTLIDLFFADKLLRPGGIICMHDMDMPSKKKAYRYLMKHRRYTRLASLKRGLRQRGGAAFKEVVKFAPEAAWHQLTTVEPMLTLQKAETFEPDWDFYARI